MDEKEFAKEMTERLICFLHEKGHDIWFGAEDYVQKHLEKELLSFSQGNVKEVNHEHTQGHS